MDNKLFECTLVTGNHKGKIFLFKNRDKTFIVDSKIIHEIHKNVEVVYCHDQAGWVEGMSEYGLGFVYSFLSMKDESSSTYDVNWWLKNTPSGKGNEVEIKGECFLDIIASKTIEESLEKIKKYNYNGNYLISDKERIFEIEIFKDEFKYKELFLKSGENVVKTNHGIMIPTAGHQETGRNSLRASSEVRKIDAERKILGFNNFTDLIKRMGKQEYDKTSILNVFRTDDYERTVSQMLLDLDLKMFHFIHYDKNTNFFGVEDKLPKDYKPKIRILIRDKKEFFNNEWQKFTNMQNQLHSADKTQFNFL